MAAMDSSSLEKRIQQTSREFFSLLADESPSIFHQGWWSGKVMDWAMRNEHFKTQLFRFVDVLPTITNGSSLTRHIDEYFSPDDEEVPTIMKWGSKGASFGGKFTGGLINKTLRSNIEGMARQFILGESPKETVKIIKKLRKKGFATTIDLLGEDSVSEPEADIYAARYLQLLEVMGKSVSSWEKLGEEESDWGYSPRINVSIKGSALYSQVSAANFEGSVTAILKQLLPIAQKVRELEGFLLLDMEHYQMKNITLEVYKRLRANLGFRDYPWLGIAIQSYLLDTDRDLQELIGWARTETLPISVRLVKGAYWDYEKVMAQQLGRTSPVYQRKMETDAAFERHVRFMLENHDICHLAIGSHNIRSIAATLEMARELGVPEDHYEFQMLYGMAEPVRTALLQLVGRVRLYGPCGTLLPGMAYLVRRLLENTSNSSFLRQSFVEETDIDQLIINPATLIDSNDQTEQAPPAPENEELLSVFTNHPMADFSQEITRNGFISGLNSWKRGLEHPYPLVINGENVFTSDRLESINPAEPDQIIGHVCQASVKHVDMALLAAKEARPQWNSSSFEDRAQILFKAAEITRDSIFELASLQVLETGKQWAEAYGDVCEAIDFLEYYGREAIRLGTPRRMGDCQGELNHMIYQGRGIAAVIAPWNFPLAISCGMTAAALVTGNPVLYKPAGPASVCGFKLQEIFHKAGLPPGVLNFIPGRGAVIGDYLVEHQEISLIAFTGSMEIGLRILNRASVVQPGQKQIKQVIAEMGGKNAIIVDDDADLDEAVRHVVSSAFGYQGQKCSACSRLIIMEPIYEKFKERLIQATGSLQLGPAEDPANTIGPVIDRRAQNTINDYLKIAEKEGHIVYSSATPDSNGFYVPITIVEDVDLHAQLAQEEIFGPLLTLFKARDMDEAITIANSSRFALTGGIFSRSPANLEKARKEFNVGNLYINRGSTGAMVNRQPFGGYKMSGIGSKAGGPDYLLQFMEPRVITENSMRRGFNPEEF